MEFGKMCKKFPLTLNFITWKSSSSCCMESCLWNDIDLQSFFCFLNANTNLGRYLINSGEYTDSLSRNLLYKTLSFLRFPLNFRLYQFIFEDLIYYRKHSSVNATDAIFPQRSLSDGIGNMVINNSTWWMLDALQVNAKAIAYLKRFSFQSGVLDDIVNQPRFRSSKHLFRTLELSSSPLLVDNISLLKSKSDMLFLDKASSEVTVSEVMPIFYSSVSSITKGQLQCFQKGGMPSFIFLVDDAPHVTYMASPQKIESATKKATDSMYLFYSEETKNRNSGIHSSIFSNLIAKMKISSSIVLKPNGVKVMETEFVLYGSREKLANEPHKSSSVESSRIKDFPKKITEILRPSIMKKCKSKNKIHGQKVDGLGHINISSLVTDASDILLPNLELAAIVVEEFLQDTTLMFNGWGLKFLEKASQKDASSQPSSPPCCSENPDGSARSMDVIVPAGLHGGPITPNGGAASLIDRWRSGGLCDCGGWDLGCPLRVLNYSTLYSSNVSPEETEKKTISLFMEGTRNSEHPTLSMTKTTEGSYSIHFRSPLSVLQSFSIAVAAIHAKIVDKK